MWIVGRLRRELRFQGFDLVAKALVFVLQIRYSAREKIGKRHEALRRVLRFHFREHDVSESFEFRSRLFIAASTDRTANQEEDDRRDEVRSDESEDQADALSGSGTV